MWKTEYTVEKILRLSPISCMYISHIQHTCKHTFIQVCMCICTCIHMASWHCNNFASFYLFSDRIKFSERAGWGRCCAWCVEGKLIGALLTFFERPQHCQTCCLSGTNFYLPWDKQKNKNKRSRTWSVAFFLSFLLTRYKHIENTHNSAGQSRGQGRVHALRLRLAACLHPRALRASTPGSSARGRAQRQRTSRFLGADSHSKVRNLLQTGASSVCVCARSDMHVPSSDMHAHHQICMWHHQICMCHQQSARGRAPPPLTADLVRSSRSRSHTHAHKFRGYFSLASDYLRLPKKKKTQSSQTEKVLLT